MRLSVIKAMGHNSRTQCRLLDLTEYVGLRFRPNRGLFPSGVECGTDNKYYFCFLCERTGYSVAVVRTEYGPLYVAGAPRHSMRGKVLVFQDGRLKQTLQGEQVRRASLPRAVTESQTSHTLFAQTPAAFSPPDTLRPSHTHLM